VVSTSAIHHLAPQEKLRLYRQCYDALEPYGILANGDEVRPADDGQYKARLEWWAAHMRRLVADNRISEAFKPMCEGWIERNVGRFDEPRVSGDDCHETIETQLGYYCDCGFRSVSVPWQKEMWAVMLGVK
jgi:hypothetical protein